MINTGLSAAMNEVRPRLAEYLAEHGVGNGHDRYITCPNPDHEDSTPSANLFADQTSGYCHGCKTHFDIFTAHSWFEDAPVDGPLFVTGNVLPLCAKYKIPVEFHAVSEEEKDLASSYRLHHALHQYIQSSPISDIAMAYLKDRGIHDEEEAHSLGIGCIGSFAEMQSILKKIASPGFIESIGLNNKEVYSPDNVIFTIRDDGGGIVGFIARDMHFKEKKATWESSGKPWPRPSKYNSSPSANLLYKKDQLLFGLDRFLSRRRKGERTSLYLFEGQFDWAVAQANGLHNCACLGGSRLTAGQIDLLRRRQIQHIIFCLDSDEAGRSAIAETLMGKGEEGDGLLFTLPMVEISVINLPDGKDPADFISLYGIDDFLSLDVLSGFDWVLQNLTLDLSPSSTCSLMIPLIVAEPSHIHRERHIHSLSESTGVSVRALEREVGRLEDTEAQAIRAQKEDIVHALVRNLKMSPDSPELIIQSSLDELQILDGTTSDILGGHEVLAAIEAQRLEEEESEETKSFKFGALTHLQETLEGPIDGTVIAIGGQANCGKTAQMSQIAKEILDNNPNVVVILMTIDDTRQQFSHRMVLQWARDAAEQEGHQMADNIRLNWIGAPKYYMMKDPDATRDLMDYRTIGYDKLLSYIKEGRLYIKDSSHGTTIGLLDQLVRRARRDQPDRRIVVILDNFHKTTDFSNLEEASAVQKRSNILKTTIAQRYGIAAFSTFEFRKIKHGDRPTLAELRGGNQLGYDINYYIGLYSELAVAQDGSTADQCHYWHSPHKWPIIEGDIGKNKINDLKGRYVFLFYPPQSRYICITKEEAAKIRMQNEAAAGYSRDEGGSKAVTKRTAAATTSNSPARPSKSRTDFLPFAADAQGHWENGIWMPNK